MEYESDATLRDTEPVPLLEDGFEILKGKRAEYGSEIVAALLRQLNWTHFTMLIPLNDKLKVEFYSEMCRLERWSTRTLREKIDSMLFERTALLAKPEHKGKKARNY